MSDDFATTVTMIRRAQAGEREVLEQLFARYLPRVRRIVASRLVRPIGTLLEHEDLLQETMLDALAAFGRFEPRGDGAFCHWLSTIVTNNLRQALRRERARAARPGLHLHDLASASLSASIFAAADPSPSAAMHAHDDELALERALLQLGDRYREVINLRSFCGLSYREIAAQMGLASENTANVLFLRARQRLQELLRTGRGAP